MTERPDPLEVLDFTPQCSRGEGDATTSCMRPARFGYTYSCGCAALMCGEHDAQMRRAVLIACPLHGPVRLRRRHSLAVAP